MITYLRDHLEVSSAAGRPLALTIADGM